MATNLTGNHGRTLRAARRSTPGRTAATNTHPDHADSDSADHLLGCRPGSVRRRSEGLARGSSVDRQLDDRRFDHTCGVALCLRARHFAGSSATAVAALGPLRGRPIRDRRSNARNRPGLAYPRGVGWLAPSLPAESGGRIAWCALRHERPSPGPIAFPDPFAACCLTRMKPTGRMAPGLRPGATSLEDAASLGDAAERDRAGTRVIARN